jgi:tripartite ATP-independent transporter DctM subunit
MFAAISGSSSATAATIGTVAVPSLRKRGYDRPLTLGSLAAGGTLGTLIPPSITMIVVGAMGQVSVARLFAGGVVPGLMWSVMFMVYIGIRASRNPRLAPKEIAFSLKGLLLSMADLWPVFVLASLVLGGIFSGFVTPTEAAALGVSGALILGLAKRQLTWAGFRESLVNAVLTSCMVIFIIMGANMLGSVLALAGTAKALAVFVSDLPLHPIVVMLIISFVYIILGCVMEGLSIVVITTPIVLPAVVALGFDPVWFGVALVMLMEMGLLTPPVGVNLFVIQGISGADIGEVVRGAMPFFLIQVIGFLPVIFFPTIITWLPTLIYGS